MNYDDLNEIKQKIANLKRETIINIHHHSMNALAKIDNITIHSDDQRDALLSLIQQSVTDQATLLHWIENLDFKSEKLLIANQNLEMLSQSLYVLSYLYQIRIKKLLQTHNIVGTLFPESRLILELKVQPNKEAWNSMPLFHLDKKLLNG